MLYHTYHYKVELDKETWYFTYDKKQQQIGEWNRSAINIKKPMSSFGTGFFVDKNGMIVTNKHVVDNWFGEDELVVKRILREWMQKNKLEAGHKRDSATMRISEWSAIRFDLSRYQYERDKARNQVGIWQSLQDNWAKDQVYWEGLLSSLGEAKFSVVTTFLGYALNGTHTNKLEDFKGCVKINVSKDDEIDLAVIQTKDKKMPVEIENPISIKDIETGANLKVGEDVSLIGYNWGPVIANSSVGLRVQKTEGKISQETDGKRILYSIPTLEGSSGSPVFNKSGKLVAIHYAGYNTTQGFNYGILAKHLKYLMER